MRVLAASLFATAIATSWSGVSTPRAANALATREAHFLEDALAPRTVAALRAELHAADDGVRLQLTVRAYGDAVQPLPGLEGAHGANLRTAEELERLWRDDALRFVLRHDGENVPGECTAVERGTLPAHAVRRDGRVDFTARTGEFTIGATFVSPKFTRSPTWCYLLADDAPRIAIGVEKAGDSWRITALESLAAPEPVIGGPR